MITNNQGRFYDDIILQGYLPKTIDVSENNYTAEAVSVKIGEQGKPIPFILAHPRQVTLKVLFWNKQDPEVWTFLAGERPLLLRTIYSDPANTESTLQITY